MITNNKNIRMDIEEERKIEHNVVATQIFAKTSSFERSKKLSEMVFERKLSSHLSQKTIQLSNESI